MIETEVFDFTVTIEGTVKSKKDIGTIKNLPYDYVSIRSDGNVIIETSVLETVEITVEETDELVGEYQGQAAWEHWTDISSNVSFVAEQIKADFQEQMRPFLDDLQIDVDEPTDDQIISACA